MLPFQNIYGLDFVNDSLVFGASTSGHVLKSVDGGIHWFSVYNHGICLYDVEFLNPGVGFAASADGYLLRTSDGGVNWTETKVADNLYRLDATDQDHIWTCNHKEIFYSTDGGLTWSQSNIPNDNNMFLYDLDIVNNYVGFIVGGNCYKTVDGGQTWFTIYEGGVHYCSFFSENKGFIFDSVLGNWPMGVLYTDDGGMNWTVNFVINDMIESFNFHWMEFYNENIGVIILQDYSCSFPMTFLTTKNGGTTWVKEEFPGNRLHVYPNPASTKIKIEDIKPNSTIEVYSLNGVLLKSEIASGFQCALDIQELLPGTYMLKVSNKEETRSQLFEVSK